MQIFSFKKLIGGLTRTLIISLFATLACVGIIKAATTIGNNITTGGTLDVTGVSTLTGNTSIVGSLTTSGANTFYGATSIGGALTATSTLSVAGLTTLGNASTTVLTVSGNSYLATTTFSGNVEMSNNLIQNIGHAGTDFTSSGGLTLNGALILNKSAGANLITTNANFADGCTNWTATNWNCTSGLAVHSTGNTSALSRAITGLTVGMMYKVQFTRAGLTTQEVLVSIDGAQFTPARLNTTYSFIFVAANATATLAFTPVSTDYNGSIDDVSVSEATTLYNSDGSFNISSAGDGRMKTLSLGDITDVATSPFSVKNTATSYPYFTINNLDANTDSHLAGFIRTYTSAPTTQALNTSAVFAHNVLDLTSNPYDMKVYGVHGWTIVPVTNTTANLNGVEMVGGQFLADNDSIYTKVNKLTGVYGSAWNMGIDTPTMFGGNFYVQNGRNNSTTATTNNTYGVFSRVVNYDPGNGITRTITNSYNYYADILNNDTAAGTNVITNTYGYYAADLTGSGTQTNTPYSFYASDPNAIGFYSAGVVKLAKQDNNTGTGNEPSPTSCGTSPTVSAGSTDRAGTFTIGAGGAGCVITFKTAFTNTPACVVQAQTLANLTSYTKSNTAITVVGSPGTYDYICHGLNE